MDNTRPEFIRKVSEVQRQIKAPKSQYNAFGKYSYRNCEDILTAANPLLGDLVLTLSDDIIVVSERVYVKSTATITDGINEISNTAFAREALTKKGQDDSQITGSTSSYARKYALNGLFLIDDTKDADHQDNTQPKAQLASKAPAKQQQLSQTDADWIAAVQENPQALQQINDPTYRARIKSLI